MVQILWKSVLEIYGNDTTLITSTIIQNTWEDLIKKGIVTPNKVNHTARSRKRKNGISNISNTSNVTASNSCNSNSSSGSNNNLNIKINNKNINGNSSTILKTNNFTSATISSSQSSNIINNSYSYPQNSSINYYYNMVYPEQIDSNYYIQIDSLNNTEPSTYISPTPQTQYQNINSEAYATQEMDCNWYNNQIPFISGTQNPYDIQNINSSLLQQKNNLNYNIQYVVDPNHEPYHNQIFEYSPQIMHPH